MDTLSLSRGFSIIELLIAMAIGIIVISGAVAQAGGAGLALGTQRSSVLAAELNADAVRRAELILEETRARSRQDFNLVNPKAATSTDGFSYTSTEVALKSDFLTKLVTATVSWPGTHGATSSVRLSTLITNLENVHAPDTCSSVLKGNWRDPQVSDAFSVDDSSQTATGNPVADMDALHKKLYVATGNTHGTGADFFVFDVATARPTYLGSAKTVTKRAGLNAIVAANIAESAYVFAASAYDANFGTCATGPNCAQLQVIDVRHPASPTVIANYQLATTSAPYVLGNVQGAGAGQAAGKSIFYRNGYVYLGLTTTAKGPGFHIIDVGNGSHGGTPSHPVWVGSWPEATFGFGTSGAPINSVYVKGTYAYVSHPVGLMGPSGALTEQLTILDVHDPAAPRRVSSFFSSGGIGGNGKVVYSAGDRLYFGRTQTSNARPEFFILDNADPERLAGNNPTPFGRVFGETVQGVLVRDSLAFILLNSALHIFDITDPASVRTASPLKSWTLASIQGFGEGSIGSALECEGNAVYVGSFNAAMDKGAIVVLSPAS